jgi:AcrR family transcriptional regulator
VREDPRRTTSLGAIVEAGLRLLDEGGLEGLSIRRLAGELGVGATTIYGYVRTKSELLDAIVGKTLAPLSEPAGSGGTWQEQLVFTIGALHDVLVEHPGVAEHLSTSSGPLASLDQLREFLLGLLEEGSVPSEEAVHAVTALTSLALGSAIVERRRRTYAPEEEAARLRSLDPKRFPHVSAVAQGYAAHISRHAFELGLNSLIAGLPRDAPARV